MKKPEPPKPPEKSLTPEQREELLRAQRAVLVAERNARNAQELYAAAGRAYAAAKSKLEAACGGVIDEETLEVK